MASQPRAFSVSPLARQGTGTSSALPATAVGSTGNGRCSNWREDGSPRRCHSSIESVAYSPGSCSGIGDGAAPGPNGMPAGAPPGMGKGMLPLATEVMNDGH